MAIGSRPRQTDLITNLKGDCYEQYRRNSLAVVRCRANQPINFFLKMESKMQNEIEILETRETPAIVWW